MPKSKPEVFVARRAFSPDGRHVVRRGTRLLASDKVYKANRDYFVAVDANLMDNDVEQATAAPGEKRNAPARAKPQKADAEIATEPETSEATAESVEG